jgi:hypothetical protein
MSDNKINSRSSTRTNNVPESAEAGAKSSNEVGDSPKVRSGEPVATGNSLLAQEKKTISLGNKMSIAMLDESAEAIHEALRDAVSAQDLDGLTFLVKAYEKSPPTENARILLAQALNTKVQNRGTILENATALSFGNPSRFDKLTALNIIHMVKALGAGNVALETFTPKTSITEKKLFSAIENEDAERLEALLKNDDIDLNQVHPVMQSPLIFAAKQANSAIVKLLIEHGADVNLQNPVGNTALHFAAMNNSSKIMTKSLINAGKHRWFAPHETAMRLRCRN